MSSGTLSAPPRGDAPAPSPADVVLDGVALRPEAVVRVARRQATVALDPAASERNLRARADIAALLERGEPLYGANTGVGALSHRAVSASDREALQWNLLRSHAVDAGPPLSAEVVRAAMAVRANQLGAGGAGVAPELLDGLMLALGRADTPVVRSLGSLGTGDLPGLARIALTILAGDPPPSHPAAPGRRPSAIASLGLRDALGFISSNAITLGRACILWHDARALQALWLDLAALSFEAAGADPVVLAHRIHAAAGGPGQIAVAARLRAGLGLSRDAAPRPAGAGAQGPVPFRVVPQVDGVSVEATARLCDLLGRDINARAENALIDDGRAWPNGNFHAAGLAAALDALRCALAGSGALIAARISAMLDPALTGGRAFLAGTPGRDSGLMMVEYAAHALAAELRALAAPVAPHVAALSRGVESHASLAPISAARLAEQLPCLISLVAAELVTAMRMIALTGRRPSGPRTAELCERAAAELPAGLEDRDFGEDVQMARGLIEAWLDSCDPVSINPR